MGFRTRGIRFGKPLAAALLTLVLASCGASGDGDTSAQANVLAEMHARHEAASRVRPFESVAEVLQNTRYKHWANGATQPLTEAVVVGSIEAVEEGRGFKVEGNDAPSGTETGFDDPAAVWRTVHVTVQPEAVVSGEAASPVVAGFAFGATTPFEAIQEQFLSFDRVVLFLNRSPVFAYDASVYGTLLDGALLGVVDDNGRISFPVLEPQEEAGLLANAPTVNALRSAARGSVRTVELDESGARKH